MSNANDDSDSDDEYRPPVAGAGHMPRLPPRVRSSSQTREGPPSPTSQIDALERQLSSGGVREREATPFEGAGAGPSRFTIRIPALPHALPGAPYRAPAPDKGKGKGKGKGKEKAKEPAKDAATMLRDAVESMRAPPPPPARPKAMVGQGGARRTVTFVFPEGYPQDDS